MSVAKLIPCYHFWTINSNLGPILHFFGDTVAYPYRSNKKLIYCWETVRRESMPRIGEMDVEMTT